MADNEVYQKCIEWGKWSTHDNGCTCYHQGFPIVANGTYFRAGATTRVYGARDIGECYAFCTEIYSVPTMYKPDTLRNQCKDGCDKYITLGGYKGNTVKL